MTAKMSHEHKHLKEARQRLFEGIGVPERAEFSPDSFQLEAIASLAEGRDTLVIAPTGAGKTFIAVQGIIQAISQGKRAIYTAPLKALSNTKYAEFKKLFEPEHRVGLLTGDRKIETDADVVVATTEIYRNDLYNYGESYSLVVLDEVHYIADPQRGPVWEESIVLSPASATLLMLSASISNPEQIASWIQDVRGNPVNVIIERNRPVELRLGFLHPELGVIPLEDRKGGVFPEVADYYSRGGSARRGYGRRGSGSGASEGRGSARRRRGRRRKA